MPDDPAPTGPVASGGSTGSPGSDAAATRGPSDASGPDDPAPAAGARPAAPRAPTDPPASGGPSGTADAPAPADRPAPTDASGPGEPSAPGDPPSPRDPTASSGTPGTDDPAATGAGEPVGRSAPAGSPEAAAVPRSSGVEGVCLPATRSWAASSPGRSALTRSESVPLYWPVSALVENHPTSEPGVSGAPGVLVVGLSSAARPSSGSGACPLGRSAAPPSVEPPAVAWPGSARSMAGPEGSEGARAPSDHPPELTGAACPASSGSVAPITRGFAAADRSLTSSAERPDEASVEGAVEEPPGPVGRGGAPGGR